LNSHISIIVAKKGTTAIRVSTVLHKIQKNMIYSAESQINRTILPAMLRAGGKILITTPFLAKMLDGNGMQRNAIQRQNLPFHGCC